MTLGRAAEPDFRSRATYLSLLCGSHAVYLDGMRLKT